MSDNATAENRPHRGLGYIIFKNTASVTVGSFVLKALNLLFSVFVVRRPGDSRFGQYCIVLAFVGLFQIFAELGIDVSRLLPLKQRYGGQLA